MQALPAGMVTFVFTDIEGSTRLFHRIGDRYPLLLERHRRILRDAWAAHGGAEVKTEGDAFFVAFADASAALAACAAGQAALSAEPWPDDAVIRVRIGVHSGLAYPRDGDYIAYAVHQAARVVSVGHGGQIVVTADAANRAMLRAPLTLRPLGAYRVRDFGAPVELHQVTGPQLPDRFPPLRTLPAEHHNLVRPTTVLVGREAELAELGALVTDHRLVSVVGAGGLGKTRLVVEWGLAHALEWPDGVWFADLATVTDGHVVPEALAGAVAAEIEGRGDVWHSVVGHLRDRHCAVIVDNCEHLLADVARRVEALLAGCAGVHVVTTSREPLGLRVERVWRPPPLSADGAGCDLFCARAGIEPDVAGSAAIEELCRRLDGLPLAIELAAARADVLPPEEILRRLDSHPNLLASRDPALDDRHRAMHTLIDWSYRLLSDAEQTALARLAVFAGGFDLDAAAVAVADDEIDAFSAVELVWSLLGKSLLVQDPAGGGTRYRMLMTVRTFARRYLEASAELAQTATRTARYYLSTLGPQITQIDPVFTSNRARELDNLRSLLADVAAHQPACAQELAYTILDEVRGINAMEALAVGRRYVDQLSEPTPELVGLLVRVGFIAVDDCNQVDLAEELVERAEALAITCPPPQWLDGRIDQLRSLLLTTRGEFDAARRAANEALPHATTVWGRARLHNAAGMAAVEQGDYQAAIVAFEASVAFELETGALASACIDLGNLAEAALREGDRGRAATHQLASLDLALAVGALHDVSLAWIVAARLADGDGDHETAVWLQAAADAALERLGIRLHPSDRALSDAVLERGRAALGQHHFADVADQALAQPIDEVVSRARSLLATTATAK